MIWQRSCRVLTPAEFDVLPECVAAKKLSSQVELAVLCLVRDFTLCERAPAFDKTQLSGTKPSMGLCSGCHYYDNPEAICWQVDEGLSDRVRQDMRAFTGPLPSCWIRDADLEVLKAVAPYVIWHRTTPVRSAPGAAALLWCKEAGLCGTAGGKEHKPHHEREGGDEPHLFPGSGRRVGRRRGDGELSTYDDPIARLDFIPALEQMR